MNSVIEGLKCVCGCYGLFASEKESQIFARDDYLIHNFVMSGLLVISNIDSCGISNDGICLCLTCRKSLLLGNRPKFGILNGLFCTNYQSYLPTLVDLSMAKEITIARMHPVISILKLRPSKTFNPAAYSDIKMHVVFLPQNLALLLTLLPSLILAMYNVICIVWVGQERLTNINLQHFILVRKQTLLNMLSIL